MQNLKLMHRESNQGILQLANPRSPLGYVDGAYVLEITDIPDNIGNQRVRQLANATTFWAAHELAANPRYAFRYDELGEGKIIRA
jgi:hypothetical protein